MSRAFVLAGVAFVCGLSCAHTEPSIETATQAARVLRWVGTTPMGAPRSMLPAAVELRDHRVLVAGGDVNAAGPTAEVYDPSKETWTATGPMASFHISASAVRLPDGRVLVVGGQACNPEPLGGCNGVLPFAQPEIYDPKTNAWTATSVPPSMLETHGAALLGDGTVLVAGGVSYANGDFEPTAQVYDPKSDAWTLTAAVPSTGGAGELVALQDGRALLVGGLRFFVNGPVSAEAWAYDARSATWSAAGTLATARWEASAITLADGRVLVTSGQDAASNILLSAELFDPRTNTWTSAGSMGRPHLLGPMANLGNGLVVMSGGLAVDVPFLATTELFDAKSGSWSAGPDMLRPRADHAAVAVPNNRILAVGGWTGTCTPNVIEGGLGGEGGADPDAGATCTAAATAEAEVLGLGRP